MFSKRDASRCALSSKIRTVSELNLPPVMQRLSMPNRGLKLITGRGVARQIHHFGGHHRRDQSFPLRPYRDHRRPDQHLFVSDASGRTTGIEFDTFVFDGAEVGFAKIGRDDDREMRDAGPWTALTAAETGHLVCHLAPTRRRKAFIGWWIRSAGSRRRCGRSCRRRFCDRFQRLMPSKRRRCRRAKFVQ